MAVNGFMNHSINGPTGSIYGHVNGNVNGDVLGDIFGQVNGNIKGDVKGNIYGFVNGNVDGFVYGKISGQVNGNYRLAFSAAFSPQLNSMMQMNSWSFMAPKKLITNFTYFPNINYSYAYQQNPNQQNCSTDPKSNIGSKNENFANCPICLKNLNEIKYSDEQLVSSQCGHIMCYCCFDKIFENKSLINCPCCGLEQFKSKYHRIFL
ncbi:diacylglycerol kinase [Brachionus plicatilis]|uniref:Diacylglycerol kinase n=1 Tax=Brachionus plicatilis TaxID=10195 RepID=A0A3M7P6R5_BRAPC|nr:diacylglycerol kinase [Brachionus plicatilis]